MFQIKVADRQTIRWYKADSLADAMALFNNLSDIVPSVEVWLGMTQIAKYQVGYPYDPEVFHNAPQTRDVL